MSNFFEPQSSRCLGGTEPLERLSDVTCSTHSTTPTVTSLFEDQQMIIWRAILSRRLYRRIDISSGAAEPAELGDVRVNGT
jgi:hypothetical protein